MANIDVVIPCFNAGAYLEQSVKSALDQQGPFSSLNVIVIDDRSNDAVTLAALDRVKAIDRVTVLTNPGPKGSAAARNAGIRLAGGDWIAFLDADDWWPIDSVARRLEALAQFPDAAWIGGDFLELNRDGTWESNPRFERNLDTYSFLAAAFKEPRSSIRLAAPLESFLKQAPTHTIVSMVRKSLLQRVGGFDERLLRQQDYHLFLRLAQASSYVFVPYVVAFYRHHESNSTRSLTHTQEWRIKALRELLSRPEFEPVRDTLLRHIFELQISNSYEFRREGRFLDGAQAALRAIQSSPMDAAAWRSFAAALLHRS